ncbi:uncharacterized protein LOC126553389 [Aphis gossypii]|uniref:uncharacterized protein LOC126553389 n=1 Tax=Aphis gossypii TaxID=80765 RepID=UPI002159239D|nr:uncharacterized protein LOC126553389 [Aphis gossypii]
MANKIDDSDILQLLDLPSGSEDDFESDVDDDQLDLYSKFSNLLEEPDITTFEGLISQQFSSESIVDEDVIFPIIEPVVDNSQFSDINISSPSTSTEPVIRKQNVSNNKKTRQSKQTIPVIASVPSIPSIEVKNVVWTEVLGNDLIKAIMTLNIFEKIRANLHFNDNLSTSTGPGRDKIHKIRPLIETLRKRFSSIPIEENLAVDEQICSTKARSSLKVYMPNNPHKWGYKFFVLSGASGFAYNFEFCSGQENNSESRKASTVRRNRLKNVMLPDDSILMKQPRGTTAHCISKVLDTDIVAFIWKDTKIVSLLSIFTAIDPVFTRQHAPAKEVRTDKLDHWPIESEKKTRCKNPGCKGFTFMMYGKCQISLCCGKGLTCFTKWHTT